MTLLERYISGEYKEVWAEMVAGTDKYGQLITHSDAERVATETMRRVRANLETIVERLTAIGYEFGVYPDGDPLYQPHAPLGETQGANEKIDQMTALVGTMPLSLRAFYQQVGSVCLAGRFPDEADKTINWGMDALWVEPLDLERLEREFADWQDAIEEQSEEESEPFCWNFSPDDFHKDNTSGGEPYFIVFPCHSADALVEGDWHHTTFVDYLRICLEWSGFPGFAREWDGENWVPENNPWKPAQIVPPKIDELRQGLLPI